MNEDALNDVRFLRDVVARTQPSVVNYYWPVTLSWGCVITAGDVVCALLATAGKTAMIPWIMPGLIFLIALPLNFYLGHKVRLNIEARGVRPRFRNDLMLCWGSIALVGLLWTAGMIVSGGMASHGYLLIFAWCSLLFVGYVLNGVLISREWFWAAAVLLASLIAAFLAGPSFYWLPNYGIGGTILLAGVLGRRNTLRHTVPA